MKAPECQPGHFLQQGPFTGISRSSSAVRSSYSPNIAAFQSDTFLQRIPSAPSLPPPPPPSSPRTSTTSASPPTRPFDNRPANGNTLFVSAASDYLSSERASAREHTSVAQSRSMEAQTERLSLSLHENEMQPRPPTATSALISTSSQPLVSFSSPIVQSGRAPYAESSSGTPPTSTRSPSTTSQESREELLQSDGRIGDQDENMFALGENEIAASTLLSALLQYRPIAPNTNSTTNTARWNAPFTSQASDSQDERRIRNNFGRVSQYGPSSSSMADAVVNDSNVARARPATPSSSIPSYASILGSLAQEARMEAEESEAMRSGARSQEQPSQESPRRELDSLGRIQSLDPPVIIPLLYYSAQRQGRYHRRSNAADRNHSRSSETPYSLDASHAPLNILLRDGEGPRQENLEVNMDDWIEWPRTPRPPYANDLTQVNVELLERSTLDLIDLYRQQEQELEVNSSWVQSRPNVEDVQRRPTPNSTMSTTSMDASSLQHLSISTIASEASIYGECHPPFLESQFICTCECASLPDGELWSVHRCPCYHQYLMQRAQLSTHIKDIPIR